MKERFDDPIISKIRKGDFEDPFIKTVEPQQIVNSRATLSGLPSRFHKVFVSGGKVDWKEIEDDTPKEDEYLVSYSDGVVFFHPSNNGLSLQFEFMSRGLQYMPASRIYTKINGSEIEETLEDIVDGSREAIEVLNNLHPTIDQANSINDTLTDNIESVSQINADLEINIPKAVLKKNELSQKINDANQTSSNLSEVAQSASTVENELNEAVTNANNTKSELDSSISLSNNAIDQLSDNITLATNINDTLNGSVVVGESKIQEISNKIVEVDSVIDNANSVISDASSNAAYAKDQGDYAKSEGDRVNQIINETTHKDEYSSGVQYRKNNIVTYNGSSYMCIQDSVGNIPTNEVYWKPLALRGRDGEGTGVVVEITSSESDLVITGTEENPDININQTLKDKWDNKQDKLNYTPENSANKGVADGYASLDSSGKIPSSQLPDLNEYATKEYVDRSHEYGSRFKWEHNPDTESLDLVILP